MSKITLPTITNGQDLSNINNNFASIAAALNNNVLYRDNIFGEPNQMLNDVDFNGFKIYNIADVTINGISIAQQATIAQAAAVQAAASASTSVSAASSAAASAAAASGVVAGALQKTNNLSDVGNASTALSNLGGLSTTAAAATYQTASQVTASINSKLAAPPAIGSTTAAGGTFTYLNSTSGALNAAIGSTTANSGNFTTMTCTGGAYNGTIGGLTPNVISATTINATGRITPSSTLGIVGTTTNDNAVAASIGEQVFSNVASGAGPTLTSGTAATVTSISLTAGDWIVWGSMGLVPAGTTQILNAAGACNTTAATLPAPPNAGGEVSLPATLPTGNGCCLPFGQRRFKLATTTTVYLIAYAGFTTSTCTAFGYIEANRVR